MDSPRPPDFTGLIGGIARELRAQRLSFMLIGGQAVLLHGRPRLTEDIDITLGADPSRLDDVLEVCSALELRPLPEDVGTFVRQSFVLPVLHDETGIRVDFIFSTTRYERDAIERALIVDLAGVPVPFATAEDLIIHKLFAGRPTDLEDAATVVRRKGRDLDWLYLETWVRQFANVPGRESLSERLAGLREHMEDAEG
jgi:predicted nucleotidyltransferase